MDTDFWNGRHEDGNHMKKNRRKMLDGAACLRRPAANRW
jgi:hypothetical protein